MLSRRVLGRHAAPKQRERFRAFTLLEMLVVIGIIAILLVAIVPAVTSLSKSSGRKGAISNLLGAIEQARAEAIKTGQPAYVVFPTFVTASQTTLERYNYKSYAVFGEDAANPKQLTNWKTLPMGIAIRSKAGSPESLTNLPIRTDLTPQPALAFGPEQNASTDNFRCIKFNPSGEIDSPAANVLLAVFEGYVNNGTEVITSNKDASGEPTARESIAIARLTGRAERTP